MNFELRVEFCVSRKKRRRRAARDGITEFATRLSGNRYAYFALVYRASAIRFVEAAFEKRGFHFQIRVNYDNFDLEAYAEA